MNAKRLSVMDDTGNGSNSLHPNCGTAIPKLNLL
jgi:hypothetical protein